MAYNDSYYGDMSADGGFSLFDLLTGNADGYQTTPAVTESYAPAADYGMGVQTRPNIIHELVPYNEPVRNIPTADYGGLLPVSSEPAYQSLPADTSTMAPAADYGMLAQSAPAYTAAAPQGGAVGPLSPLGYVYGGAGDFEDVPVNYSPETQAYFNALNTYIASQNPTYGNYSWGMPAQTHTLGGGTKGMQEEGAVDPDRIFTRYTPESAYASYITKPVEQNALYQFNLPDSSGNTNSTGNVRVSYNTPIALVDNRTGQLVYSGTGFDAAQQVAEMARKLSQEGGNKAEWSIYTAPPGATDPSQFTQVAQETQNKGILGVLGSVLPLAISFIPGFQALSLPAKMAAAAGAGGLGAAIAGNDILKGALLSGATAGLVSGTGLDKALGSALQGTSNLGSAAATELGQKAAEETGGIVVKGLGSLAQAGGTALGQGVLGTIGNSLITSTGAKVPTEVDTSNLNNGAVPTSVNTSALSVPSVAPAIGAQYAVPTGGLPPVESLDSNQIVVAANKLQTAADAINAGAGIGQLAAMGLTPDQMDVARQYAEQTKDQIVVPAQKPIVPGIAPLLSNAMATIPNFPGPSTLDQAAPEPTDEPITVEGKKPIAPNYLELGLGSGLLNQFTSAPTLSQPEPTTLDTTKPKSLLDQILKYGSLASLASSALGDLFGGGGGAGGATTPYTSVLGPAPVFGRGGFQPYTGDYETYATRPEWNFFTPTTTPAAAPTTQTYTPLI